MKCPICNGKGTQFIADYDGMYDIVCDKCKGKGELDENGKPILTNEEYLKSCNTEQLAEFLNLIIRVGPYENEPKDFWEHVYGRGGECGAKSIVTWLKQPHNEKE